MFAARTLGFDYEVHVSIDPNDHSSQAASRSRPRLRLLKGALTVLLVGVLITAGSLAWRNELFGDRQPLRQPTEAERQAVDTDGDGIRDVSEVEGWRTRDGSIYVTDPSSPDTDGDGLTDDEEAGSVSVDLSLGSVREGLSDPTRADSDGDGLDDATEADGGYGLWVADTDADGLDDMAELEFGSDPLLPDADFDGLDDAEERAEGSDPTDYDLSFIQGAAAFIVGASTLGTERPADIVLSQAQIDSWQFLAGSYAIKATPIANLKSAIKAVNSVRTLSVAIFQLFGSASFADVVRDVAGDLEAAVAKSAADLTTALRLVAEVPVLDDEQRFEVARRIVALNPEGARLPADSSLRGGTLPAPLPLTRPISTADEANAAKDDLLVRLMAEGYADVRVNELQSDAEGLVVGSNHIDVQATDSQGVRHYFDFTTANGSEGPRQLIRALRNDDTAEVHLIRLP